MSQSKKAKTEFELQMKAVNTLRLLSVDMVQAANSGHPGMPMGCAPMAYVLYKNIMKFNPKNPSWFARDRFVLSNGHGCALLYSMLYLTGYECPSLSDLKNFRQINSPVAGHPESHLIPAVEVTTGPLGQGICNGVGMAITEKHLAAVYNKEDLKIVDNFTYVMCGDGCLQEGVSGEASSLAGHLKLGKLIVLYDDNDITIDGGTNLSFTEDVGKRYEAYGWEVLTVSDGDKDLNSVEKAILAAKASTDKPTIIKIKTTIGFGSSKQGTSGVHGSPLGDESIKAVKSLFGFNPDEKFAVPSDVKTHMNECVEKGQASEMAWEKLFNVYAEKHPVLAAEFTRRMKGELAAGWEKVLPTSTPEDKAIASRSSSGVVLNKLAEVLPELVGGSADLTPSNKTQLKCSSDFQGNTPAGRYFRFGVREHGMAAICNGMSAYGGVIPFCATFLNFTGYAAGAMRLSALAEAQVLYIMTHDSIGLGEDGPTHQPIEAIPSFRAMPNFYVFRPADSNEVAGSYREALLLKKSPSMFCLSRQNLPNLKGSSVEAVAKGAYILQGVDKPSVILAGTGSEVSILVEAAAKLTAEGVKVSVVSMPCQELFEKQDQAYKVSVFPSNTPVLAMEAAGTLGWERYAHATIGMRSFGKSGPIEALYPEFGFTADNAADKAKKLIAFYKDQPLQHLVVRLDI